MYGALDIKLTAKIILLLYAVVMLSAVVLLGISDSLWGVLRSAGFGAACLVTALSFIFGLSGYWSPWRIAWRLFPGLNEWVYPDLNGVWYGTTRSNWPVIAQLRSAASSGSAIKLEELPSIDLLAGEIAVEVKASFFKICIRSKVSQTGADSYSSCVCAEKRTDGPQFQISYLYRQHTPQPISTDEDSHVGAATLVIKNGAVPTMTGSYWTKRKWREGMNTAGLLALTRLSARHPSPTDDLLAVATAERTA